MSLIHWEKIAILKTSKGLTVISILTRYCPSFLPTIFDSIFPVFTATLSGPALRCIRQDQTIVKVPGVVEVVSGLIYLR